jgi:predicted permease
MFQLRVALRSLTRQPSFAAIAIGALALGIAAPTALFAVVEGTLLRPLPYKDAGDIYTVRTTMTNGRFTIGLVATEEISEMRRATDLVTDSAVVVRADDSIVDGPGGETKQIVCVAVSKGFFELFGVPMAIGRSFAPDEFATFSTRSAVLSDRAWRTLFAADPLILGKTIRLGNGLRIVVVGVAPAAFDAPHDTDIWYTIPWQDSIGHGFDAYIRLRPGTKPQAVQAALAPMWAALGQKYPDMAKDRVFVFRPLLTAIVGDLGPIVVIAFSATALLLLLAIANVANLLLARGAARTRDLAVRLAIGATRGHLIRQLLAESMVIAMAAAAIGIPLAYLAIRTIVAMGGNALPRGDGLRFDPWVAIFATAVMALAGILVGLLPALSAADTRLTSVTNESGRSGMQSRRTRRMLAALVVAEVTLAVALVAGAGRMMMSARNLLAVDPGFDARGRLVIDVLLPFLPYGREPARAAAWMSDVTDRLNALGATRVGMATSLPLRREWDATTFTDIAGRQVDPRFRPNGRLRVVSPSFFETLGIGIVAGRAFTAADGPGAEPVVMVNEAWVRKFLPAGADPLHERIDGLFQRMVDGKRRVVSAAIIGVAGNVRYSGLDKEAEPVVYFVDSERFIPRRSVVLTTADDHPENLVPAIRKALAEIDPNVPIQFETMPHVVSSSLVWSRLGLLLMATFGAVSLLLAGIGVFGVLAFAGAQRHGEMAVRLSLGATRREVFGLVLAQGARLALAGAALGAALAWWMGRLMSAYVYQVSAANAAILIGSAVLVGLVALAATLMPAHRASTVDPARVLRQ